MYGYGLGEAVALQLRINSPVQRVGETPTYILTGAPPGQTIAWTSYHNGEFTGELNSTYGQVVEPNGTAQLVAGGPWREEDLGTWQKIATFPDGTSAIVNFQVAPASAAPSPSPSPVPAADSSWLDELLDSLRNFEVTPAVALIGLGALYLLTKKR